MNVFCCISKSTKTSKKKPSFFQVCKTSPSFQNGSRFMSSSMPILPRLCPQMARFKGIKVWKVAQLQRNLGEKFGTGPHQMGENLGKFRGTDPCSKPTAARHSSPLKMVVFRSFREGRDIFWNLSRIYPCPHQMGR